MKRIGVVTAAVLVVALLVWWQWPRAEEQPVWPALPAEMLTALTSKAASAARVAASAKPQSMAEPKAPIRDDAWCENLRRVFKSAAEASAPDPVTAQELEDRERQARRDLLQGWVSQLNSRGDEESRALALYLQGAPGPSNWQADPAARQQLVELAASSQQPAVFALARRACTGDRECLSQLPARQWLRIDPGNQFAWRAAFEEAQREHDPQAMQEALYQIGLSTRSDNYVAPVMQIMAGLPIDTVEGPQGEVAVGLYAEVAFSGGNAGMGPTSYCKRVSAGSSSESALCSQAAHAIWKNAQSMIDLLVAQAMASVSKDADLASSIKTDLDTVRQAVVPILARSRAGDTQPLDPCASIVEMRARMLAVASRGEVRWAHEQIAASAPAR